MRGTIRGGRVERPSGDRRVRIKACGWLTRHQKESDIILYVPNGFKYDVLIEEHHEHTFRTPFP